jgi:hypothetical protein
MLLVSRRAFSIAWANKDEEVHGENEYSDVGDD